MLAKLLKLIVFPSALLVLLKITGVYIVVRTLSIQYFLTNNGQFPYTIYFNVLDSSDAYSIDTYSNLFLLLFYLFYTFGITLVYYIGLKPKMTGSGVSDSPLARIGNSYRISLTNVIVTNIMLLLLTVGIVYSSIVGYTDVIVSFVSILSSSFMLIWIISIVESIIKYIKLNYRGRVDLDL